MKRHRPCIALPGLALAAMLGLASPAGDALPVEVQYQGLPGNPTVKASIQ